MGKAMKVVWPQGKNLKPQPKGRAPVQAIPCPAPTKTPAEKRKDQEYRLALSKGHYPRSPMAVLLSPLSDFQEQTITREQYQLADPFAQIRTAKWVNLEMQRARAEIWEEFFHQPGMLSTSATSTKTDEPAVLTVEALAAAVQQIKGALNREPIEVTEEEYRKLQELPSLPVAETPQELADLVSIFGTAVMVMKADPPPLDGEILPPEQPGEIYDHRADATAYMMMGARKHSKRVFEEMMLSMYRKRT